MIFRRIAPGLLVAFVACAPKPEPLTPESTSTSTSTSGPGSAPVAAPPGAPVTSAPVANGQLPGNVHQVLTAYVQALRSSASLEECAGKVTPLAGGTLVNEDGRTLRSTVAPFSLKKDFSNVKFYADPIQITRVDALPGQTEGYGASAVRGTIYKVWIAKASAQNGMPAPIAIIVPEGHAFVKEPRVVGIGSL